MTAVSWRLKGGPWYGMRIMLGFLLGYFLLHPISMVIFRRLDPHFTPAAPTQPFWLPIVESFYLNMLPMGIIFGVVGAVITFASAYHRRAVAFERDALARQLEINDRYRAELERHAEQLRRDNDQLAKLERENRRTTEFMVHDFRNHLSCIQNLVELLEDRHGSGEDISEHLPRCLQGITRHTYRILDKVNNLLELSRLQQMNQINKVETSPSELIKKALENFALMDDTETIRIGEGHTNCPTIKCDPLLLERVLSNLVSNALKHNPPGTRVILDAHLDRKRNEILFWCKDNGEGIPSDLLPTLFSEFASGGNERASDSTGLGLAFCKAAVEAHCGSIWCESSRIRGTTFYFTIPMKGMT